MNLNIEPSIFELVKGKGLHCGPVSLTIAGKASANAGMIYVKADGQYVGKITTSGRFFTVREADSIVDPVVETIDAIIAGGAAYIAEQGRISGVCGFCGLTLDDPESVARGYGPVCAKRHGLPHGNRHGY